MASKFSFPPGIIPGPVRPLGLQDSRHTVYKYELLTSSEAPKGSLDGVKPDGTLTWDYSAPIKSGGQITIVENGQEVDWLNDRIKISVEVNGVSWGLGVFLPTAPDEQWEEGRRLWSVELHDKLSLLEEDTVLTTYTLAKNAKVTDAVKALIQGAGETNIVLTDSDELLSAPRVWAAGTSILTICNELLDSAGYFTLRTDHNGAFVVKPYVAPHLRGIQYDFSDNEYSIYSPQFTHAYDIFNVPNRVVAIQQGTGDAEGVSEKAENVDPLSPFSYPSRGRWITRVYSGVEATSAAALKTYARRRLTDSQRIISSLGIEHAPMSLRIYDAVTFKNTPAGLEGRYVIDRTEIRLDPTALSASVLRQVVTYG